MMKRIVYTAAALAASATLARAVVVFSDSFSYADGSLTTNSSFVWTAHSGTTGQTQVAAGKVQLSQNQSEDVSALLTNSPYSSGNLYASCSVNLSALPIGAGNYFLHFKDTGTSIFRAKVFATTTGAAAGSFRVGLANVANTPVTIPTDLALGATYTLVLRYNTATPASSLWINPDSESSTANRVDASDPASTLAISTIALRQSTSSGNGMGVLTLDDLKVGTVFADVVGAANQPPGIITQPQSQMVVEGSNVTFTVLAAGNPPPGYQWRFNGTNLAGATNSSLTLTNVAAIQAGSYVVVVTNPLGSTNSQPAILTVRPVSATFSLLTYNTHGNSVEDWSTNSAQVQAIGRQMMYLQPDIVTFQEISVTNTWEMTNFVAAYLPGYDLTTNSGDDGFIRSVIASRFPITRSSKWLDGMDLRAFGYSNANNNLDNFTRDLFEAQITVPGLAQPVHVFTVHLKSGQDPDDANKRAAEASAISNFFATYFLPRNASHPYVLTGDMNESDIHQLSIQRLISAPTGLQLTTPVNPYTASELTFSIQSSPTKRYDYIMPGAFLFTNLIASQVFRTDKLNPVPPNLNSNDDIVASDHLPVLMQFNKPDSPPFRLTSIAMSNQTVTLKWESASGRQYRVEASADLTSWNVLTTNLTATGTNFSFSTNAAGDMEFFRVYRVP